jgi:hypothetical protein
MSNTHTSIAPIKAMERPSKIKKGMILSRTSCSCGSCDQIFFVEDYDPRADAIYAITEHPFRGLILNIETVDFSHPDTNKDDPNVSNTVRTWNKNCPIDVRLAIKSFV